MAVGGAPCMVNRITYTGDLGYEIWMQPAYQRLVYKAIKEAGEEFGIVDFGMRALLSMRLEKNFPTWFRELRPIYGPFEGAMDRFIKLEKNDFIGREAAAKELRPRPKLRRVSLIVDARRRRRDGRRADLGQGQRQGLRHGREAARLRRAALRRGRQGGARLDGGDRRIRRARHHRRRLARGRLGDLGRLCALCRQVDGAGLRAGGARRERERGPVRDRDPRAIAARPASMSSRRSIRAARRCGGSGA